jgi:hypothetical protein
MRLPIRLYTDFKNYVDIIIRALKWPFSFAIVNSDGIIKNIFFSSMTFFTVGDITL